MQHILWLHSQYSKCSWIRKVRHTRPKNEEQDCFTNAFRQFFILIFEYSYQRNKDYFSKNSVISFYILILHGCTCRQIFHFSKLIWNAYVYAYIDQQGSWRTKNSLIVLGRGTLSKNLFRFPLLCYACRRCFGNFSIAHFFKDIYTISALTSTTTFTEIW